MIIHIYRSSNPVLGICKRKSKKKRKISIFFRFRLSENRQDFVFFVSYFCYKEFCSRRKCNIKHVTPSGDVVPYCMSFTEYIQNSCNMIPHPHDFCTSYFTREWGVFEGEEADESLVVLVVKVVGAETRGQQVSVP